MSWTGLSTSDRSIEALISIMMSQSIVDAKKNLPLLEAPGQNIMLVDKESVSLVTAGAIPERNINHNTSLKNYVCDKTVFSLQFGSGKREVKVQSSHTMNS